MFTSIVRTLGLLLSIAGLLASCGAPAQRAAAGGTAGGGSTLGRTDGSRRGGGSHEAAEGTGGCGFAAAFHNERQQHRHAASSSRPVRVPGLTDALEVALHRDTGCARRRNGRVTCWALPAGRARASVVELPGIVGARSIALGQHGGCAVVGGGTVTCWSGNLAPPQAIAVAAVPGLSRVRRLVPGADRWAACALQPGDSVACFSVSYGSAAGAPTVSPYPAERVPAPGGVADLAVGDDHLCIVRADRTVICTGDGEHGQLGVALDSNDEDNRRLVPVPGLRAAVLAVAAQHACAVDTKCQVVCWGANHYGQIGDGSFTDRTTPVVVRVVRAVHVAVTDDTSCAVGRDGSVWC